MQKVCVVGDWRMGLALLLAWAVIGVTEAAASSTTVAQGASDNGAKRWAAMVPKYFKNRPEFAFVKDDPSLPRVVLIGDSISIGYTMPVRKRLAGRANVHRIPKNGQTTAYTMERLSAWLGDGPWDVIHFNWGLHDLIPSRKIDLQQYERNLEMLVRQLQKTGATLIWASTTPVPEGAKGREKGRAALYNEVARKVMARHGIAINDLHSFALPQLDKIQKPADVHFTPAGSEVLGAEVAKHILAALDTRATTISQGSGCSKAPFKVLFSNDLTNILSCGSPFHGANEPFRPEMIAASVDETIRAGVDAHMLQPGFTYVPLWKSKIYPAREHLEWYRSTFKGPTNSILEYVANGGDVIEVFVKHCRKRSMPAFVSLRMNDYHYMHNIAAEPGSTLGKSCSLTIDRWRREHFNAYGVTRPADRTPVPEDIERKRLEDYRAYEKAMRDTGLSFKVREKSVLNWSEPEVRERIFAFVREICEGYDIDGLELDFMRHSRYFRLDETSPEQRVAIITDFVSHVRELLNHTSKPGRHRWLCVRIPAIIARHDSCGIDLKELVHSGLDMVNLSNHYYTVQTTDLARICEMVPETAVYLEMHYATAVQSSNKGQKFQRWTTDEQYETTAHLAYAQGAQGISLFNFQYYRDGFYPHRAPHTEPPFQVLGVLGKPDLLARRPQHYFLYSTWTGYLKWAGPLPSHVRTMLPGALKPGDTQELILDMAPPQGGWRKNGTLRIQANKAFGDGLISARMNGVALEMTDDVSEPYANPYPAALGTPETLRSWIVPADIPRRGTNRIEITLKQGRSIPLGFVDLALP